MGRAAALASPMIKITGGALRGRVLPAEVPEGVRPTSSRAREALFSIVGQDLSGVSFLDAFGGAGAVALEAASRGAAPVTVFERAPVALAAVAANAKSLKTSLDVRAGDTATLCRDVRADIVYLDPPYDDDIGSWIARLAPCAIQVLVAEGRKGSSFPAVAGPLPLDRIRTYGDASLAVYRVR
ncbi:MAG: 16S rRNA (guanine(966)-N(2))-methyltransferase RsmD [Myxococcales bacterium]|nr:16S rRNA (guanine(966)-N(2))-methyltransferase RsmD [Myxococcales bacterium]